MKNVWNLFKVNNKHCVKSVRIWSFSGPHSSAFVQNTERYLVSLRIQSKYRKIRTRKTPNTDMFYAVKDTREMILLASIFLWEHVTSNWLSDVWVDDHQVFCRLSNNLHTNPNRYTQGIYIFPMAVLRHIRYIR